jgi:hypothetical protein
MIQMTERVKPQMLTLPQLAAQGILPARAIRRLVSEKKIPTVKVGTRTYINLAVFEKFLTAGEAVI